MEDERVPGKLKHKVEDFIVEEIGENWKCSITKDEELNIENEITALESQEPHEFLWCELEKVNIDHFQAIKELANSIRKGLFAIGYAGTKDRFAHTVQRISIFQPDLEAIKRFNHDRIILKKFKWAKRKIRIGYLDANRFTITIREVDKKDAIKVTNTIRKCKWFPNYFGQQRFGSLKNNNYDIGKLILKRDFKEAVIRMLTDYSDQEREDVVRARIKLRKEMNFTDALTYFPQDLRNDRQILYYLSKNPEDNIDALQAIDSKTLLLLVNSVQSKIFNDILKKALDEGIDFTKEGQKNCILVGYRTNFYEGRLGEIEQSVLKKHNLKLEDFNVTEIPFLRLKGSYRKAITTVDDMTIETAEDEEFPGTKKITLSFTLPSGVYATTFLENFFYFPK
jgi:tRNA pseudouridine13 synthase